VSAFREPVIGDDLDIETYGRPSNQRTSPAEVRPRAHAAYDRSAVRARRVNSHRPAPAKKADSVEQRVSYNDAGVRTVRIAGQATPARSRGVGRSLSLELDRFDRRPDRAAQWALFIGVFMIVVAIVTGT
jgi:hypothetical protein